VGLRKGVSGQRNMRKDLSRVVLQHFYEALTALGYTGIRRDSEWRRQQFHLFIRKKGNGLALRIHEDMPSSLPPFHRARHKSKALEQELAKIEEAYKRKRATPRRLERE